MSNQYDEKSGTMTIKPDASPFTIISNTTSILQLNREAYPSLMHAKNGSNQINHGKNEIVLSTEKKDDMSCEFNFLLTESGFQIVNKGMMLVCP